MELYLMYNAARRQEIIRTVFAPSVAVSRAKILNQEYTAAASLGRVGLKPDGTAPKGRTFVSRANPVGAKGESLKGDTAKVSVDIALAAAATRLRGRPGRPRKAEVRDVSHENCPPTPLE